MKLKIISDGTATGTKLIDEASGEAIGLVQSIKWEMQASQVVSMATVTVLKVPFEAIAEAEVTTNTLTLEPIKKYEEDESMTWEERYRALQAHHTAESTYLINKLRAFRGNK